MACLNTTRSLVVRLGGSVTVCLGVGPLYVSTVPTDTRDTVVGVKLTRIGAVVEYLVVVDADIHKVVTDGASISKDTMIQ